MYFLDAENYNLIKSRINKKEKSVDNEFVIKNVISLTKIGNFN